MNWNAISSIATFIAVIVALLPIYSSYIYRIKRKRAVIQKLHYIFELLLSEFEEKSHHRSDFLTNYLDEINRIMSDEMDYIPLQISNKIMYFLFCIRLFHRSKDAYEDLQYKMYTIHTLLCKYDVYFHRDTKKAKKDDVWPN